MSAARTLASFVLMVHLAGCAEDDRVSRAELTPVELRTFVDRSEAYVGDPVGVSIELVVPGGVRVRNPDPVSSAVFETERLERLPVEVRGTGQRYAWRWTVRPRVPGRSALPALTIPLELPDKGNAGLGPASTDPDASGVRTESPKLQTSAIWLDVRSIRAEMAAQLKADQKLRTALFDIRSAPRASGRFVLLTLVGLFVALAWACVAMFRSRPERDAQRALARRLELLRASLPRSPDELSHEALERLLRDLRIYTHLRYGLGPRGWTSAELPEVVDASLRSLLCALERARFARSFSGDEAASLFAELQACLRASAEA